VPVTATLSSSSGSGANGVASTLVLNPEGITLPTIAGIAEGKGDLVSSLSVIDVPLPPEIQNGDTFIIGLSASRSTASAFSVATPEGVTKFGESQTSTGSSSTFACMGKYKAGDPLTVSFPLSVTATYGWVSVAYAIRGADSDKIVAGTPFTQLTSTATTTIPIPEVVAPTDFNLIVGIAGENAASAVSASWPAGINERTDATSRSTTARFIALTSAYIQKGSAGAFAGRSVTYSSSNQGRYGIFFAIPPLLKRGSFFPFFV